MTKIKLCGITRMEDIESINQLGVDYIGFVFAPKSKRYITPQNAKKLRDALEEGIQVVGVFVDAPMEYVASLLDNQIIDIAQLHGEEDADYIKTLKELCHKPVIKAFRMNDVSDTAGIEQCCADYVLLDSGAGSGEVFDWNLMKEIKRPFFLAGGLGIQNVEQAIQETHPFAVDVSSGIETGGLKDKEKMAAFVTAAKRMN